MTKNRFINNLKTKMLQYFRVVVVLFTIMLLLSLVGNVVSIRKAESKITEAEDRVAKLKQEREDLERNLSAIESNFYVEKQLRDSLGLSREGEIVLVLPEETILRKLAPVESGEEATLPEPNWKKWLSLFM